MMGPARGRMLSATRSRWADQFRAGYAETDSCGACRTLTERPGSDRQGGSPPSGRGTALREARGGPQGKRGGQQGKGAVRERSPPTLLPAERLEELRPSTNAEMDGRALRPHCCSARRSFASASGSGARRRSTTDRLHGRGEWEIGRLIGAIIRRPQARRISASARMRRSAPVKPRDPPDQQPSPPGRSSPTARSRRRSSMSPRPGRPPPTCSAPCGSF